MNIVVCVKQVPDTTARKRFGDDFRLNRAELESVINPFDEYAIEEALRLKEATGGEVCILTMGPSSAEDMMRKALAMGADRGVLITDEALAGSDWLGTARALVGALKTMQFDVVLTGMESTDARTGLVPGGLAELLDLPLLTNAGKVELSDGTAIINRQVAGGYRRVEARLPVVISVVKGVNEPRYPSLKGIMASKRKEISWLSATDVGVLGSAGHGSEKASVSAVVPRPERSAGQKITPESVAEAAGIIADFLAQHKFI